jgi:hypothetical protein
VTESAGTTTVACPGCGARVADIDGPVHVYVPSAPGCWAAFGELRADEMLRFPGSSVNNLTVDSYMAQHPGDGHDRRDRQSVFIHLAALCAVVERGGEPTRSPDVLRAVLAGRTDYPTLTRPDGPGEFTVLHPAAATDMAEHDTRTRQWAESVWGSWQAHHATIRAALHAAVADGRRPHGTSA